MLQYYTGEQSWGTTYIKFGERIGQLLSLPPRFVGDFRHVASFLTSKPNFALSITEKLGGDGELFSPCVKFSL